MRKSTLLLLLLPAACGTPSVSNDAASPSDAVVRSDTSNGSDTGGADALLEDMVLRPDEQAIEDVSRSETTVSQDAGTIDVSTMDVSSLPDVVGADTQRTDATPGPDAASGCEAFGRFPAPMTTFTLPTPRPGQDFYYPDVQRSFPMVDWNTLDRLYIPAGTYRLLNLGNLPNRTAARPLVITNTGGQVRIVVPAGSTQGYIWVMNGGSNWILTGRYDETSRTGDARFPGHRCGRYENTREQYGFFSDGILLNGGHMGLSVSDANSYEIEFIETTRAGFAGVRLLNRPRSDGTVVPMDNVRFHDNYVHDTGSEGLYFGWTGSPPSVLLTRLQVYNNRIIRTGTETAQLQNLGDGTEVHHNVFAYGAIDWRAAFDQFQDNGSQTGVRSGTIRFHHNVLMGGAASLVNYFTSPETGDGPRTVSYADNYFADTLSLGIYLGGTAMDPSRFSFERNVFRGLDFGYTAVNPMATDPGVVLRIAGTVTAPVVLQNNRWEGSRMLVARLTGGNGTTGNVMGTGNSNTAVPPIAFVNTGLPANVPTRRLEMWTATASLAPMNPPVRYDVGAYVMHQGELYECIAANTNAPPDMNPTSWRRLPRPVDDFRLASGSPYAGIGLQ